jgi:hypothetical protein
MMMKVTHISDFATNQNQSITQAQNQSDDDEDEPYVSKQPSTKHQYQLRV